MIVHLVRREFVTIFDNLFERLKQLPMRIQSVVEIEKNYNKCPSRTGSTRPEEKNGKITFQRLR